MLLMECADEITHFRPEDPLHRPLAWSDDTNIDLARAQRSRDLQSDKAGADHDGTSGALCRSDYGAAIIEGAEGINIRLIRAGNGQAHGSAPVANRSRYRHLLAVRGDDISRAMSMEVTSVRRRRSIFILL